MSTRRSAASVTRSALAILSLSALATTASAQSQNRPQRRADSTFSWTGKMAAGATLAVRTQKGDVSVRTADGDVAEVRGVKRESRWSSRNGRNNRRGRDGDGIVEFTVEKEGNDVAVCAVTEYSDCDMEGMTTRNHRNRDWDESDSETASFTVLLPRGVKLAVSSGNGDVTVVGAGEEVRAASGNGEVRVSGVNGGVRASSGNGAVSVEGARGAVTATSGNGRVIVSTSNGPVTARSGNGDIEVSMAALTGSDDMNFTTGNGRIIVTVPSGFAGNIDANQPNGEIRSDFPITITSGEIGRGRLRGTIGGGGRRVRMTTGNGRIEIRKAT